MIKEKNNSLGRRPTSKVAVEKKEALLCRAETSVIFGPLLGLFLIFLELNIAQHAGASSNI